jgi:hypothetical protein
MRREIKDLSIHAYLDVTVVHGRKPGGSKTSVAGAAASSTLGSVETVR